jgi:hypothetical protein
MISVLLHLDTSSEPVIHKHCHNIRTPLILENFSSRNLWIHVFNWKTSVSEHTMSSDFKQKTQIVNLGSSYKYAVKIIMDNQ